jgi:hypothetical protein
VPISVRLHDRCHLHFGAYDGTNIPVVAGDLLARNEDIGAVWVRH